MSQDSKENNANDYKEKHPTLVEDRLKFTGLREAFSRQFSEIILSKTVQYNLQLIANKFDTPLAEGLKPGIAFLGKTFEGIGSATGEPGMNLIGLPFDLVGQFSERFESYREQKKSSHISKALFGEGLSLKQEAHQQHYLKTVYELLGYELFYVYEQQIRRLETTPKGIYRFAEYLAYRCLSFLDVADEERLKTLWTSVSDENDSNNSKELNLYLLLHGMVTLHQKKAKEFQFRGGKLHFHMEKLHLENGEEWGWKLLNRVGFCDASEEGFHRYDHSTSGKLNGFKEEYRKYFYRNPIYVLNEKDGDRKVWRRENFKDAQATRAISSSEAKEGLEDPDYIRPLYFNVTKTKYVKDYLNLLLADERGESTGLSFNDYLSDYFSRPVVAVFRKVNLSKLAEQFTKLAEQRKSCSFAESMLSHVSFKSLDLRHVIFDQACLPYADFTHSILGNTSFREANLSFACFEDIVIENSLDFRGSNLSFSRLNRIGFPEDAHFDNAKVYFAFSQETKFGGESLLSAEGVSTLSGDYSVETDTTKLLSKVEKISVLLEQFDTFMGEEGIMCTDSLKEEIVRTVSNLADEIIHHQDEQFEMLNLSILDALNLLDLKFRQISDDSTETLIDVFKNELQEVKEMFSYRLEEYTYEEKGKYFSIAHEVNVEDFSQESIEYYMAILDSDKPYKVASDELEKMRKKAYEERKSISELKAEGVTHQIWDPHFSYTANKMTLGEKPLSEENPFDFFDWLPDFADRDSTLVFSCIENPSKVLLLFENKDITNDLFSTFENHFRENKLKIRVTMEDDNVRLQYPRTNEQLFSQLKSALADCIDEAETVSLSKSQ